MYVDHIQVCLFVMGFSVHEEAQGDMYSMVYNTKIYIQAFRRFVRVDVVFAVYVARM